uniref:Delta(24)-sterol reductase n=1 Tax=Caenorhabditis tropicalis TaxID=1561998 RepID=A0A1I7TCQ8_9PELO
MEEEADERPILCERFLEFIMFHFRWVVVVPILLPLSFIFNIAFEVRNRIVHFVSSAPNAHVRKVKYIQEQLKEWSANGRKTKLVNARPGWLTMSFRFPLYKENATKIATDKLFDILELDTETMTVKVEPGVTMGQISRYLIPLGYTLPVLPELDDLTVGGLINGCGVESGSFKYGMFQHICTGYEVVMSNGELNYVVPDSAAKTVKAKQDTSLYYAIPWSQGTICFLVAATIKIIPCKKYVKLTYKSTKTLEEMCSTLTEDSNKYSEKVDFVEALLFDKNKGCIMLGEFSDGPDTQEEVINSIGRWYKKWFYTHVEDLMKKKHKTIEYIPLRDYYHRHSKSIFWELRDIVPFGNNVLFRYLLAWMCPPKIAFLKATTPNILRKMYNRSHVLQDMLVPLETLKDCVELFHDEVEIYPLWICPFHLKSQPGLMKLRDYTQKMYVDIGAYGCTTKKDYHHEKTTRRLEKKVREVNGFQMTYADVYMTRAEYREMFDVTLYDYVRSTHKCLDAFPDVYDKICRSGRR